MNIIELLKKKGYSISTAESLTAGMIASLLCQNSGASKYFKGGIVSYTKETKCKLLDLKMEDIEKYGVYSSFTVEEMAKSIKEKTCSDISIATSGVAGPGPDEEVEAGTVYFCFIILDKVIKECRQFAGNRNKVRKEASKYAIDKLKDLLINL